MVQFKCKKKAKHDYPASLSTRTLNKPPVGHGWTKRGVPAGRNVSTHPTTHARAVSFHPRPGTYSEAPAGGGGRGGPGGGASQSTGSVAMSINAGAAMPVF